MDPQQLMDTCWLLVCSALVFLMQAGFCCLESGLVRTKNTVNVALKNLVDMCLAGTLFWLFGSALMFGESWCGFLGTTGILFDSSDAKEVTRFLFQLMFCGTATTIVAGAVAERMRFQSYLIVTALVAGLLFPLFGHWAWADDGWLATLGFRDFAGATVVHSVGAWTSLAACMLIGPRIGRFDGGRKPDLIAHNLPMATIGVMLLWFGWFGFNGGSGLVLDESVPRIVTATMIAGMAGGLIGLSLSWATSGRADITHVMNSVLGGLVASTASCNLVTLPSAACIGAVGGAVAVTGTWFIERLRIDDAVGAIPVHGFCGVWGTLAVALFAPEGTWDTGFGRWAQLRVQFLGSLVCFLWTFGFGIAALYVIGRFFRLRVSEADEQAGLNISEHNATTETHQLVTEMDTQRLTGDFSQSVSVESHTEIGQIASQYNRVLAVINREREELVAANDRANAANANLQTARVELEEKLTELADFNEVAVDRELRMIELKQEINELMAMAGLPAKYDVDLEPTVSAKG